MSIAPKRAKFMAWVQGWIKVRLPVLFRTDSFRTQTDLQTISEIFTCDRQFWTKQMQKICAKVPPHFRSKKIYNKQFWEKEKYFPHQVQNFHLFCCLGSPESPLYWRHNASRWYFSTLLEKCWLYVSIDSFEDFLVDQDRQFQNTPNSRVDSFRFVWTYIHPCRRQCLLSTCHRSALVIKFTFQWNIRVGST